MLPKGIGFKIHVFAAATVLAVATVAMAETPSGSASLSNEFRMPLSFELNQGQAASEVKALSRGSGYGLLLTARESILMLRAAEGKQQTVLRFKTLGGNPSPEVSGVDLLPGTVSYYTGNDPTKWRAGIATYARIRYASVYPGIDLIYHGNQGELEYDFVVAPGAAPSAIRFAVTGARKVRLDKNGDLALATNQGTVLHRKPILYQDIDGKRRSVDGRFVLNARNEVSFDVGEYERQFPLVIDPSLGFYTYYGGTGTDQIKTIAVTSPSGLTFFGGLTTSTSLPAADNTYSGGSTDGFLSAVGSNATSVLMTLFLGGTGTDGVNALALDPAPVPTFLAVTGLTNSTDFPTLVPEQPVAGGNFDAFVTKFNISISSGVPTATMAFSTYLGGSSVDVGYGIAVSSSATGLGIFAAGSTLSDNFPTVFPYQPSRGGNYDAFLTKFQPSGAFASSTYFGGPAGEQGMGVAVYNQSTPTAEAIPFVGGTVGLSGTTSLALAFSLGASGTTLNYAKFFGSPSAKTTATGIAVDNSGNAYITGLTNDAALPLVNPVQATYAGGEDAFIMKLDGAGNTLFSTYYGGIGADKPNSIAVDTFSGGNNNIVIAGQTNGNFPVTAVDTTFGGVVDGFVVLLNGGGASPTLNYATYVGGAGIDIAYSVCVGSAHNARVAGITNSPGLATSGVAQTTIQGGLEGFVVRLNTN